MITAEEFAKLPKETKDALIKVLDPDWDNLEMDKTSPKTDFDLSVDEIPKVKGAVKIKIWPTQDKT